MDSEQLARRTSKRLGLVLTALDGSGFELFDTVERYITSRPDSAVAIRFREKIDNATESIKALSKQLGIQANIKHIIEKGTIVNTPRIDTRQHSIYEVLETQVDRIRIEDDSDIPAYIYAFGDPKLCDDGFVCLLVG